MRALRRIYGWFDQSPQHTWLSHWLVSVLVTLFAAGAGALLSGPAGAWAVGGALLIAAYYRYREDLDKLRHLLEGTYDTTHRLDRVGDQAGPLINLLYVTILVVSHWLH